MHKAGSQTVDSVLRSDAVQNLLGWLACQTVDSVLRSDAVQNLLCWLACFVHNGPPSPKFQISQLRQMADRAASLSIKSLWSCLFCVLKGTISPDHISLEVV